MAEYRLYFLDAAQRTAAREEFEADSDEKRDSDRPPPVQRPFGWRLGLRTLVRHPPLGAGTG